MADISQKKGYFTLDHILGLRAWGLILYGILPAYFSLLDVDQLKGNIGGYSFIGAVIVGILPLTVLFLFVKGKIRTWYLLTSRTYLNIRSLFTTIMMLLGTMLVGGISGLIHNEYIFGWSHFIHHDGYLVLAETFILAVVSLVVSAALLMTALTRDVNYPLLPSKGFSEAIAEIKKRLDSFRESSLWQQYSSDEAGKQSGEFGELEKNLKAAINEGNFASRKTLRLISEDVAAVRDLLDSIKEDCSDSIIKWNKFFIDDGLDALNRKQNDKAGTSHLALQRALIRLKNLK